MKKLFVLLFSLGLVLTLSACRDRRSTDSSINIIFYTYDGGTKIESLYHQEPNILIPQPEDPERIGYTFTGWYTDVNQRNKWDFETNRIGTISMVLFAGWSAEKYNIIYDLQGGTLPEGSPTEFSSGERLTLPRPVKTGYRFLAWYLYDQTITPTKPGDSGLFQVPSDLREDLVIYAHYEELSVQVQLRVVFPGNQELKPESQTITVPYGGVINFPDYGVIDGYRFVGWNSNREGTGTYYRNGDILERRNLLTLYSIWEKV